MGLHELDWSGEFVKGENEIKFPRNERVIRFADRSRKNNPNRRLAETQRHAAPQIQMYAAMLMALVLFPLSNAE